MAGFQGIRWASTQMKYDMKNGTSEMMGANGQVCAVNRSIHYGLFLCFEGIRFRCNMIDNWLHFSFLDLDKNVDRFRRSMAFQLADEDQDVVPSRDEIKKLFLEYLSHPDNRKLFLDMAATGQYGYLRPFSIDEDQSIGVTFPQQPCIRMVAAGYDEYLGEPFDGVVVPNLVRAVGVNGTGCLKLGMNYLLSVKAVQQAKKILPTAGSALFLDDRPYEPIEERLISEWDSSCCLLALKDGTFIKIPEGPLILPSVTIRGITDILMMQGEKVEERDVSFGELENWVANDELVTICSIGTAGTINRVRELHLFDGEKVRSVMRSDETHPSWEKLGGMKKYYWDIYSGDVAVPEGHKVEHIPSLE